jgi:hypothetical protein
MWQPWRQETSVSADVMMDCCVQANAEENGPQRAERYVRKVCMGQQGSVWTGTKAKNLNALNPGWGSSGQFCSWLCAACGCSSDVHAQCLLRPACWACTPPLHRQPWQWQGCRCALLWRGEAVLNHHPFSNQGHAAAVCPNDMTARGGRQLHLRPPPRRALTALRSKSMALGAQWHWGRTQQALTCGSLSKTHNQLCCTSRKQKEACFLSRLG